MFITEIGLNHKGSEKRAFAMLEALVATDIDAITFQIAPSAFYEKNLPADRQAKEWGAALNKDFYKDAIDFVHKNNKLIGFAIADKNMVCFLDSAGADFWKSLSISISDDALLHELQKTNKTIFVSTGISGEREIVKISKKLKNIKFIHTQLSQKLEDSNLRAIDRLRKVTKKEIAFGLHCANHQVLYLLMAFEPSDVFFYVKDNPNEKFPDNEHAIMIHNVNTVVNMMKKLKKAIGNGIKKNIKNRIT